MSLADIHIQYNLEEPGFADMWEEDEPWAGLSYEEPGSMYSLFSPNA